ncbi:MAG: hypothetical protein IJ684_05700 [Bacteroidales bacterium]|nr:hypothetical protein [Bacteroidales bacterium]
MKARHILLIGAALLLLTGACQKSRYCRCVTTDTQEMDSVIIVNVDRSMRCKRLTGVGSGFNKEGKFVESSYKYTCEQMKKDSLPTVPNLPRVQ